MLICSYYFKKKYLYFQRRLSAFTGLSGFFFYLVLLQIVSSGLITSAPRVFFWWVLRVYLLSFEWGVMGRSDPWKAIVIFFKFSEYNVILNDNPYVVTSGLALGDVGGTQMMCWYCFLKSLVRGSRNTVNIYLIVLSWYLTFMRVLFFLCCNIAIVNYPCWCICSNFTKRSPFSKLFYFPFNLQFDFERLIREVTYSLVFMAYRLLFYTFWLERHLASEAILMFSLIDCNTVAWGFCRLRYTAYVAVG